MRFYLLGGRSGTDFLVLPYGLSQPKAVKGIVLPGFNMEFGNPKNTRKYKTRLGSTFWSKKGKSLREENIVAEDSI